ncbi:MAG TPA: DUF5996 family protein [Candidatus Binatia bacterium]|jgi:hypothetical protein
MKAVDKDWPELPYAAWKDTYATLHLWTQIVGKVRLAHNPWLNHSWQVTLYVTPHGLTTAAIPRGERAFELAFDFMDHLLLIHTSDRPTRRIRLEPKSVADFYGELMATLRELDLAVELNTMPCEIAQPTPFELDRAHASYDSEYAQRFGRVIWQSHRVLERFRSGFIGKASPVHFFWGSFDLAVTRFSGRRAPLHPGGVPHLPRRVAQEAYSHEVSSAGFWPGNADIDASFYAYAYPEPEGFRSARVAPKAARFEPTLGEFVLPYASVREARDPDAALLEFLQATYAAAADRARWDRAALECDIGQPGIPRTL